MTAEEPELLTHVAAVPEDPAECDAEAAPASLTFWASLSEFVSALLLGASPP